jgi:hypothetical protein
MTKRTTMEYARVRSAPETEELGLAGRIGFYVAETRPSSSGMRIVGNAPDDYALAVFFEDLDDTFWFPPELLESVNADGSPFMVPPWRDVSLEPRSPPEETVVTRFLGWLEQFLPKLG